MRSSPLLLLLFWILVAVVVPPSATGFYDATKYATSGAGTDASPWPGSAIQTAVTACGGTSGCAVFLPAGTWQLSSTIVMPSGTRIFGDGYATKVTSTFTGFTPYFQVNPGNFGTELTNIRLVGPGAPSGSARPFGWFGGTGSYHNSVRHCWFENFSTSSAGAVTSADSYDNIIEGNVLIHNYIGIALNGAAQQHGNLITGNTFRDNNTSINAHFPFDTNITGNHIDLNTLPYGGPYTETVTGISLGGSYGDLGRNVITGNVIHCTVVNCDGIQIQAGTATGHNKYLTISGNAIHSLQEVGISIFGGEAIEITGNQLDAYWGVVFESASGAKDCFLTANTFSRSPGAGVYFFGDSAALNTIVADNLFYDTTTGIFLAPGAAPASNTKLHDNTFGSVAQPIFDAGAGTVNGPTFMGESGRYAKFNADGTIGNAVLTESGGTINTNGHLVINGGTAIASHLSTTAILDFNNVAGRGCSTDMSVTVVGAALGDTVAIGVPNGSVNAGSNFFSWVSATDTVTVRHCSFLNGGSDPAPGTFRVDVWKH